MLDYALGVVTLPTFPESFHAPTHNTCFTLLHTVFQVSYILYLVDEDWGSGEKPDGGGLQLYPLEKDGVPGVPAYAPSKTIPPRWNQMVLFAVQPGRSFHDVQEVGIKHDIGNECGTR